MKKLLIFMLVSLSTTIFAQHRPALKTYDCNMSRYSCHDKSEMKVTEVKAYTSLSARNKCQRRATKRGLRYCGIDSYTSGGPNLSYTRRAYNCEMARDYCGLGGGRYTQKVYSTSQYKAYDRCRSVARRKHDQVCQVTLAGGYGYGSQEYTSRRFTCLIDTGRRGGCRRPGQFNIRANGYDNAKRKCNNKARNMRRRLCQIVRR